MHSFFKKKTKKKTALFVSLKSLFGNLIFHFLLALNSQKRMVLTKLLDYINDSIHVYQYQSMN